MTYLEFVKKAQNEIKDRKNYKNSKLTLHSFKLWEEGNQINLWTYWQGYQLKDIDKKGVDILLVGLDWGNVDKPGNERVLGEIRKIQNGDENTKYIAESQTDEMLKKLFMEAFKINIMEKNPKYRLFFTNYLLGYRRGEQRETGDTTTKLMKMDQMLFEELVSVVKPKVIICLGKDTYEMVSGENAVGFSEKLQSGKPFKVPYYNKKDIMVYGVAHPGYWGIKNVKGENNMLKAWKEIAEDFKNM